MSDRPYASEAAQRLAAMYAAAEATIARGLAQRLARGIGAADWTTRRLAQLGEVRRWVGDVLSRASGNADAQARLTVGAALLHGAQVAGGRLYRGDPEPYVTPLLERLRGAERRATDAAAEAFRGAVLAGGLQLTGSGATEVGRRRAVQRALNQAVEQGITGFTDRTGRRWSLAGYVEMAAQTAATEAVLTGQLALLRADGQNLVIVSSGPQECERCRHWMGKVLTIDDSGRGGATLVLPSTTGDGRMVTVRVAGSLSEARLAGLFHPRCRCRIGLFRPGLTGRPVTRPDPDGQAARDRLRALERRVRELRLREAAALTPEAGAAARDLRLAAQVRVRMHVQETAALGVRRDVRRERLDLGYAQSAPVVRPRAVVEPAREVPSEALRGQAALDSVPTSAEVGHIRRPAGIDDRSTWLRILSAIRSYRGVGFTGTNAWLRHPERFTADDARLVGRIRERVERIDQVMAASPLPEPIVVYRGVADVRAVLAADGDAAFQSSSTDEFVARQFADPGGDRSAVIEMRVPAGVGAVRLSGAYDQSEILLQRGLRWRVVGERTVRGRRYVTVQVVH